MKLPICLSLSAALLLAGCGGGSDKPASGTNTAPSTSSSDNNSGGYLGAITRAQQGAVKTVDTASISQAIQLFSVDKGRYPKDLNELVQDKYIPQLPSAPYGYKLDYDAAAGKVQVVKE